MFFELSVVEAFKLQEEVAHSVGATVQLCEAPEEFIPTV
jgi:hypothetical protein